MNSDVEKFIKGESKNSYNYFGAHKVSDGVCFRLYAPHAKEVEVVVNDKNYKMERIDFRGVYEVRVKDIKEFDRYYYEILTNDSSWINKNDPYTFYSDINKSVYLDKDEYKFVDDKWINKKKEDNYFNACILNDHFKLDDQRAFIDYLKEYNFNYLILRPYDEKYLYCVNKCFINESSLKTFIDNLHQVNIGVIFDFDTSSFFDYDNGLNDFDGLALYNLEVNKYKEVGYVYFDYTKNHTRSYILSFINYYLENFHGDGLYINDSEFNKEVVNNYLDKVIIYKGKNDNENYVNDTYLTSLINNLNEGFNYKKFIELETKDNYSLYDYNKYLNLIKGNEKFKHEIAKILLSLNYLFFNKHLVIYNDDKEYLEELKIVSELSKNSKAIANVNNKKILYNGKKNNYFAYEFSSRNDYILLVLNFSDYEDEKFDLGVPYYGYYKLVYDSSINGENEELFSTRSKKAQDKTLALKMALKPYQVLIYRRMKDI